MGIYNETKAVCERIQAISRRQESMEFLPFIVNIAKAAQEMNDARELCENVINYFSDEQWINSITISVSSKYNDDGNEDDISTSILNFTMSDQRLEDGDDTKTNIKVIKDSIEESLCCYGGQYQIDASAMYDMLEGHRNTDPFVMTFDRAIVEKYIADPDLDPFLLFAEIEPAAAERITRAIDAAVPLELKSKPVNPRG